MFFRAVVYSCFEFIYERRMAELIQIDKDNIDRRKILQAVEILRDDGLIIYPTDTVYGLGCSIRSNKALEKLSRLKGVKLEKASWSFVCSDLKSLSDYVSQIDTPTFKVLKRAFPGPFTIVLPGSSNLPKNFKFRKTVGIRIPDHPIPRLLVEELGSPIVSTSIRDEDELIEYTTDPAHIYEKWYGKVDAVIDSGYGDNMASTILEKQGGQWVVLRHGKGDPDDIL